jgi:DNA-binding IclR family transcriptional regulator
MENEKAKGPLKNQSTVKALDIIELLAYNIDPMRLQDISESLKMNASTALRFLESLAACGYVKQNPETLRYYLTFKICSIANKVSENIHLYDIAQPYLKRVSAQFDESVCLAIEQDMTVVYIGVVQRPDQMLRSMQRIGNRAPMHCTGVGKLMLLNHEDEYIDKMIESKGLQAFTANTITTREQLQKEIARIREQGYSWDDEECEIGANCIAVPIFDYTRKIIAGMSVTGPTSRLTKEKMRELIPFLLEQAQELSRILGYDQ